MWKKIGNCSFCGKDLGRGINYQYIRDGFICSACRDRVYGYAVEELNYLSFAEIAEIIDEYEKYAECPELKLIPVRYFRGYPMHGEKQISLIDLIFYNEYLMLRTKHQKFRTIIIFYKDILDIKSVDETKIHKQFTYYLEEEHTIQIQYFYEESPMTLILELRPTFGVKRSELYDELFDFVNTSGIREKFRKNMIQNQNNIADNIRKFKELLDIGAITEEEYEKKKKELLNI